MPILPTNTDPSQDYVLPGISPPLTVDGLVYNKIYAHTGVIDSLSNSNKAGYADPNLNIINNSNGATTFTPELNTSWISSANFGGINSSPVILTYYINNTTYYNTISLSILNVPCFVELLDNNMVALPDQSTFQIIGGNDIYTKDNWLSIAYNAPSTLSGVSNINLRITRNKNVQSSNPNYPGATNVAYSIGVKDFRIALNILQSSDVPASVISGTNSIVTQNRFGLVESYSYSNNPVSNIFVNDKTYWRSAPQPTGDSIVFFYVRVSDPIPAIINRLYINPLYSNCKFNVYYTTNTGPVVPYDSENQYDSTSSYDLVGGVGFVSSATPYASTSTYSSTSTYNSSIYNPIENSEDFDLSNFTWSPIQRDFTLRKGVYELPDTFCTYLKFEFTKLVPEAYDLPFDTVNKLINVFPQDVEQYFSDLENDIVNGNSVQYSLINKPNITSQTQVSNNISPSTVLGASTSTIGNSNSSWPSLASLNNSQLGNTTTPTVETTSQVVDPTISYKLIDYNGDYNNQSYTQFLQRQFLGNRTHTYSQVTIPQSWHEAYFTGIVYLNAFYENHFDEIRTLSSSMVGNDGTTNSFASKNDSAVILNPDNIAVTPWVSTIDTFNSFSIAGLTTDWRSFLTQGNPISYDNTLMNGLTPILVSDMIYGNAVISSSGIGTLGTSTVYSVSGSAGSNFGIKSLPYTFTHNLASYYDSNFIPVSGSYSWYGLSSTTVTGTSVTWQNGIAQGTANGITVSGGSYVAAYTFTLPGSFNTGGTAPYTIQFGTGPFGTVGYAEYTVTSGIQFYFSTNLQTQVSGTTSVTMYSSFINPTTSGIIAGTTVTGTTAVLTSGINSTTVTGTSVANYSSISGLPSNMIQLMVSGTGAIPYQLYQFGIFSTPGNVWTSAVDRTAMRISGAARMFLLSTNSGSYRASLTGLDSNNVQHEVAYKVYTAGSMPSSTWFDIELEGFTGTGLTSFAMQVVQTNTAINELFYVSMLAPFYHPVRYEYTNVSGTSVSGTTGWYPIVGGINDSTAFISTASGLPASGIQVRMTALDPNVFISGVSVVPNYKQNPFYSHLEINYLGNSKTNELSARTSNGNKPYFQLNTEAHPSVFNINRIASTVIPYTIE